MIHLLDKPLNELPNEHKFNGIDLFKFIFSILVCLIHILTNNNAEFWIRNTICRIAVPFFFVSLGFFVFRRMTFDSLDNNIIKNHCFKLLRFFGTWTFLLFLGGLGQLWFLGAAVLAVLLIFWLLKIGIKPLYISIVVCVLYVIGLVGQTYSFLFTPLADIPVFKSIVTHYCLYFETTRNGLFFGSIFVWIGAIFSQKKIQLKRKFIIAFLIISLIVLFVEVDYLKGKSIYLKYDILIALVPITFIVFYIASHLDLKDNNIYKKLRIVSILVFFTHMFVDYIVIKVMKFAKTFTGTNFYPFHALLTICFSLLLALIIEKMSNTKRFSFLKFLYS